MVIGGKTVPFESCKKTNNTNTADYIWVGYDDSAARLPVAIAPTADALAKIMGVKCNSVESCWSKFRHGQLKTAKYAKVYIGGTEDDVKAGD